MKLLIFCFIISVSWAFDFDCLKGPEFWCKEFSNAQKCGKITECFMGNKIKENNLISQKPLNSGLYCSVCLEIGEFLNKKLETKQKFIDFINKEVCENLQGETQNICKLLVSQYGPFIYDKIKTELNPHIICKLLKVCDTKSIFTEEDINNLHRIGSSDLCKRCKEFFQVIQSLFAKITPDDLKLFLENLLCNQLPSEFQSTCKMVIDGYATQLYELIKTLLDGDRICPLIHLCSDGVESPLKSWNCDTCVDIVTVIKRDLINVREREIENFVKSSICAKLNFIERTACNGYVPQLVPTFYNEIHSGATPKQICNRNNFCHSSPAFVIDAPQKMTGAECEACRFAIVHFKKLISDPTVQAIMKQFLKNKICSIFQSEKNQCQQLVDEYFNIILNFLITEFDVDKICQLMNLCSSNVANVECSMCEVMMDKVIAVALADHTEHLVATFVSTKICPALESDKDECVTLVNTYLPIVFSIAHANLNSKVLCKQLKLCTFFTNQEILIAMENIKNGSIPCKICLFITKGAQTLLTNPTFQMVIKYVIGSIVCPHMPSPKLCVKAINQYFEIIVNIVVKFLKPTLCYTLHLCHSTDSMIKMSQPVYTINTSENKYNKECHLCSKVYRFLQSKTGRKYRTNGVIGLISLCNQLDNSEKSKCLMQLQNLSAIVKSFNKSTSLGQFCTLTNMCSDIDEAPRQRLGEHPCSWGPAFWCISQWHASSCGPGATKHCEMKVWSQTAHTQ